MRGVEPLSEKRLPRLSTSVVDVLTFPYCIAQRQAIQLGSSWCVTKPGALLCSHLPLIDAPYTAVVLCAGTSSIKLLKQLYFCQLFLSYGFYGGSAPPLAYQGLHSPSKPLHPRICSMPKFRHWNYMSPLMTLYSLVRVIFRCCGVIYLLRKCFPINIISNAFCFSIEKCFQLYYIIFNWFIVSIF